MAENHKLRLEIDASKARAGKNQFVGALDAISRAVIKLERDGSGAFVSLTKNASKASAAIKATKFKGVDARVTKGLESFANAQLAAYKAALKTKRNVNALTESLVTLSSSYVKAKGSSDLFTKSIWNANTALGKQFELASKVAAAQNASRTAGGTGRKVSKGSGTSNALVDQGKLQKSIAATELSVERLSTRLLNLGAFSSMQKIGSAFREFNKTASKSSLTAKEFSAAVTKMDLATKRSQTSLVTLTAKAKDEARALRDATKASKDEAKAAKDMAKALDMSAKAIEGQTRRADKQKSAQLSAAGAMRKASSEAQRMSISLQKIGDAKGMASITAALATLQKKLSSAEMSTLKLKEATNSFNAVTAKAKENLTAYTARQREAAASSAKLAKEARAVSAAAAKAEQQIRRNAATSRAASSSWDRATGSMRGLENSMSSTFQIGSALRVMFGSLTLGSFITSVYEAGTALEQFNVTMEIATGSAGGAAREIDNMDALARQFGTNLRGAREDFSKFAVASSLAGVSMGETRKIFESVSMAMSVMGRGAEDQRLAFLALEQMMSKGTISSEELRRQLGERLPGAVNLMAKAVGVTTGELQKLLKAGALVSSDVLPKFADEINKAFGPGLEAATKRASFNIGTAKVELEKLLSSIGESGFMKAVARGFNELTRTLQKPAIRVALEKLGENLARLTEAGIELGLSLVNNIEKVGKVANAIFTGLLASTLAKLAASFVTSMAVSGTAIAGLISGMTKLTAVKAVDSVATLENMTAMQLADVAKAKSITLNEAYSLSVIAGTKATVGQTAANGFMARSFLATGAGIGKAAGALAVFGKFAGALALPIALITAGTLLFKSATADTADAAEDMADAVDAAMRRAGVSFDEFTKSTVELGSAIRTNSILADMTVLEASVTQATLQSAARFADMEKAYVAAISGMNQQEFVLAEATTNSNDGPQNISEKMDRALEVVERTSSAFDDLTESERRAASQLLDIAKAAGQSAGGFNSLRDAAARTVSLFPNLKEFVSVITQDTDAIAARELALSRSTQLLVELYGTPNDKLLKTFASEAEQVLATGTGLDDLIEKAKELSEVNPEISGNIQDIVDKAVGTIDSGSSVFSFRVSVQSNFDEQVVKLRELRDALETTRADSSSATSQFSTALKTLSSGLSQSGEAISPISRALVDMANKARVFTDMTVSVDKLSVSMNSVSPATDEIRDFEVAVRESFEALPEGEKSYAGLVRVIDELQGTVSDTTALRGYVTALLTSISGVENGIVTYDQLLSTLDSVEESTVSLTDTEAALVNTLINATRAVTETAAAERSAAAGASDFATNARQAGSAAEGFAQSALVLKGALSSLRNAGSSVVVSAQAALADAQRELENARLSPSEQAASNFLYSARAAAIDETREAYEQATEAAIANGESEVTARNIANETRNASLARIETINQQTAAIIAQRIEEERTRSSSGGGGGSAAVDLNALQELTKATEEHIASLKAENIALAALAEGQARTAAGADYMAEAMLAGKSATDVQTDALFMQIEAAALLNEELTKLANDPVNDWMKAVPNWVDAGQQIETDVIGSLSSAISEFIQTGKIDFQSLGESILGTIADIVADKAMKELVGLLGGNTSGDGEGGFGLGGILGGLFSSQGDTGLDAESGAGADPSTAMAAALQTGGQQAAQAMHDAMVSAGESNATRQRAVSQQGASGVLQAHTTGGGKVAADITTSMNSGATRNRQAIQLASGGGAQKLRRGVERGSRTGAQLMASAISSSGGGGGGGLFGTILGGIGGAIEGPLGDIISVLPFKNGGVSGQASAMNRPTSMPIAAFNKAPSYAKGTANTSGIPAVLHPNEAVVPLAGGRKIPVELGNETSKQVIVNQVFNIATNDVDSFRKSQDQVSTDMSAVAQASLASNG